MTTSTRSIVRYRSAILLGGALLIGASGCIKPHGLPAGNDVLEDHRLHSGEPARSNLAVESFDAGNVIAGIPVTHTFLFHNPLPHSIQIVRQHNIQTTCGCTKANVTQHKLAAGESTEISLHVRTQGKRGKVRESATISWQSDHGEFFTQHSISADLQEPLSWTPAVLRFTAEDIQQHTPKTVTCQTDLDIDLRHAQFTVNDSGLVLSEATIGEHGRSVTLSVTCVDSTAQDATQAWLRIDADTNVAESASAIVKGSARQEALPRQNTNSREMSHRLTEPPPQLLGNERTVASETGETVFSASLPIYIDEPLSLRASPSMVRLHHTAEGGSTGWSGHFVLSGKPIASGDSIRSISCGTVVIPFATHQLGKSALSVRLAGEPSMMSSLSGTTSAEVVMKSGQVVNIMLSLHDSPAT